MKKLFCSKISHNPYKEEMITEIIERVFQIDGYCVEEKIEGVLFDIHFDDEQVTSIKISNTNMRKYFEDNFNKERFFNKIKEHAESLLVEGDEVDVPLYIKDKYFKNGINVAYIKND
jgi:hypothetical protein